MGAWFLEVSQHQLVYVNMYLHHHDHIFPKPTNPLLGKFCLTNPSYDQGKVITFDSLGVLTQKCIIKILALGNMIQHFLFC